MSNIVIANFVVGRNVTTRSLFQYNKGMKLRFANIELPETYRVDFSNSLHGTSKSMVGHNDGVEIPYEYFIPGENIYAWIVTSREENETVTEYQVKIPVDPRAEPTDAKPSENQINFIDQTIAALNAGVSQVETATERVEEIYENIQETVNTALQEAKDSGQFDGPQGIQGERGAQGEQGIQGIQGIQGEQGPKGDKGDIGPKGDKGDTGSQGLKGDVGATGPQGPKGDRGDKGDTGEQGPQGVQGPKGDKGDTGEQGPKGDAGETGPKGDPGDDYVLTAADKAEIAQQAAQEVDVPVQDVQVNGVSVLTDGVANVPIAGDDLGVVKIQSGYGITKNSAGRLYVAAAGDGVVKSGTDSFAPIVPIRQHISVFYGLSKAAGSDEKTSTLPVGQYTESAKSAISTMLNGPVTVSGTTPSITAQAGIQYVCGEVATLDITLPASGCVDVVFESGSTPTVLTVTPPSGMTIEWANGFDSTALEADTLYEINIKMVGTKCLGVAASWT